MAINFLLIIYLTCIIILFFAKKQIRTTEIISTLGTLIEAAVGFYIIFAVVTHKVYGFGVFEIDSLSALLLGINLLLGCFTTLYAVGYLRGEREKKMIDTHRSWQCYLLMQFFLGLMAVALTTTIPMIMWIAIEGTTLSTAFLIQYFRRKHDMEASWKYLIINTVGLLLAMLGTILFLSAYQNTAVANWTDMKNLATSLNHSLVKYGFAFLFIGYGTKMGLVPMHTWKPDAYNKGPIPITALLATALLNIAFYAILRFKVLTDIALGKDFTTTLFLVFGISSVVLPSIIMYTSRNFKRFFAYSSIENAGILLLGFAFGGLGVFASLLHIVYHSLAKALIFLVAGNIALKYSSSEIRSVRGLRKILPVSGILLILSFLALTGIPPFGIFFTKMYIILAGLSSYPVISIIMVLSFILAFVSFLRMAFSMFFGEETEKIRAGEYSIYNIVSPLCLAGILLVTSLYMFPFLTTLIEESKHILGY